MDPYRRSLALAARSLSTISGALRAAAVTLLLVFPALVNGSGIESQRRAFLEADRVLANGRRVDYRTLRDYPLYPYLVYRDLRGRLDRMPRDEVRAFLRDHGDTPLAERLRRAWLRKLAEKKRWHDYLADFLPMDDVELECWRRQALRHTGYPERALDGIEDVWISGYSRPDSCDPLFAEWKRSGGFTPARVWARFELAMEKRQRGLATYLRKLLPPADRRIADRWLAVDRNPRLVRTGAGLPAGHERTARILLHGIDRWSRRDSVEAAAALDTLRKRYRFPTDLLGPIERRIALYVSSRGHPSALARLLALPPPFVDDAVREWRVRLHLHDPDWRGVRKWLRGLTNEQRSQPRWRYWKARALEATGEKAGAEELFRALARERDYYGFLAADRVGLPYAMVHDPLPDDPAAQTALLARVPALVRARELRAVDRTADARIEWRQAIDSLDTEDLQHAAVLAHGWQWYSESVRTVARSGHLDDLQIRFPLAFQKPIERAAAAAGLKPRWPYAVMRQESLFQPDIRSSANAIGLMQLLPGTAKRVARRSRQRYPGAYGLVDPEKNVRLGTAYLRELFEKLGDSPVLATASYNAGPHRVKKWLPESGRVEADLWIETIPFAETRSYVQRVIEYSAVYSWRLDGRTSSIAHWLQPIRAGQFRG